MRSPAVQIKKGISLRAVNTIWDQMQDNSDNRCQGVELMQLTMCNMFTRLITDEYADRAVLINDLLNVDMLLGGEDGSGYVHNFHQSCLDEIKVKLQVICLSWE